MKQRDRAEARHRRAEMLELIRSRRAFDALDHRHRPVVTGEAADHAAERAPFVERLRRQVDANMQGRAALFGADESHSAACVR